MGSGTILLEVLAAIDLLKDFDVSADVWSATSFTELRRDALTVQRWNQLNPDKKPKESFVNQQLKSVKGPIVAATDYIKSYADSIQPFVKQPYYTLGTDGFGRSDTRQRLRHHFEVSRYYIAYTALVSLFHENQIDQRVLLKAREKFNIDKDKADPRIL